MARARRRSDRDVVTLELNAEPIADGTDGEYECGSRIFHRKFGYGTVGAVEGDRLDIEFDKAGRKKVIAGFVVPAHRAG